MKICIINNLYEPFNKGGAETITKIINKTLIKDEHQTKIISTKPYTNLNSQFPKTSAKNKIYINSMFFNLDKIPILFRFFWHIIDTFDVQNYFKIKKILKNENFDIVITNNLKGIGLLTPLAIKKMNLKHIHILHDVQLIHPSGLILFEREKKINNFLNKLYYNTTKLLFANIGHIVSPSQWLLDTHTNKGFFKNSLTKVIENPIPPTKNLNHNYKKDKKFDFLYVGQIEDHKGIFFLIDTFKKYLQTNPDKKLKIIGDGSQKNKLKLNKNIEYLGKKSKAEIKEIMSEANCLIVPSLCYENSPTVIYEALNENIKIIASNIGGIPEIINKTKNTFLFQTKNSQSLIEKINKALNTQIKDNNFDYLKKLNAKNYIKRLLS